jgi:hypothetical protein
LVARWQLPAYWQFGRYLTALDTGLPELDFMLRQTGSTKADVTVLRPVSIVANRCGRLSGQIVCSWGDSLKVLEKYSPTWGFDRWARLAMLDQVTGAGEGWPVAKHSFSTFDYQDSAV